MELNLPRPVRSAPNTVPKNQGTPRSRGYTVACRDDAGQVQRVGSGDDRPAGLRSDVTILANLIDRPGSSILLGRGPPHESTSLHLPLSFPAAQNGNQLPPGWGGGLTLKKVAKENEVAIKQEVRPMLGSRPPSHLDWRRGRRKERPAPTVRGGDAGSEDAMAAGRGGAFGKLLGDQASNAGEAIGGDEAQGSEFTKSLIQMGGQQTRQMSEIGREESSPITKYLPYGESIAARAVLGTLSIGRQKPMKRLAREDGDGRTRERPTLHFLFGFDEELAGG